MTLPGGGTAIVCGPRQKPKPCSVCGAPAALLCDGRDDGKRGTCDKRLCHRCTTSPSPNVDLCPAHAPAKDLFR